LASSSRISSRSCSTISAPPRMENRSPAIRRLLEASLDGKRRLTPGEKPRE
jgi:hypothetical protein